MCVSLSSMHMYNYTLLVMLTISVTSTPKTFNLYFYKISVYNYCCINIVWILIIMSLYVIVFWKTDHLDTRTEIHLLPVCDWHTHALSRNTNYWTIDCPVCFYRQLFTDNVKPQGYISWSWGALIGLYGVCTKLLITAVWASLVDCISSCHLLKAQHCSLSPNGCFTSPLTPHRLPPPTPIDSIRDITGTEKTV